MRDRTRSSTPKAQACAEKKKDQEKETNIRRKREKRRGKEGGGDPETTAGIETDRGQGASRAACVHRERSQAAAAAADGVTSRELLEEDVRRRSAMNWTSRSSGCGGCSSIFSCVPQKPPYVNSVSPPRVAPANRLGHIPWRQSRGSRAPIRTRRASRARPEGWYASLPPKRL